MYVYKNKGYCYIFSEPNNFKILFRFWVVEFTELLETTGLGLIKSEASY